jgi:hypothetical protein
VKKSSYRSVSLTEFLKLGVGSRRLDSLQEARQFYVDYHVLLSDAGIYSCAGILMSASRGLFRSGRTVNVSGNGQLVFYDGESASGLRTISDLKLEPLIDMRPQAFLGHLDSSTGWRLAARLARAVTNPASFFEGLFDAYVLATEAVLDKHPDCSGVITANERSLGCAPSLAATKFQHHRRATVVQHGNPIGDYLPTIADEYWCRSDRWHDFLRENSIVSRLKRITDFPGLSGVEFDPDCRRAVLVMHNVGYLEPDLDYGLLSDKIKRACERAGWTLYALRHPANKQSYGLPVVDRRETFRAGVGIGFRSTATDQLPREMARVSLLDYWPDFFLREGSEKQLEDYFQRIDEALT